MVNKDIIQGKWNTLKGAIKEKWGKLTDDDLTQINGKREQLIGKLQQRYGWAKDKTEEYLNEFERGHSSSGQQTPSFFDSKTAAGNKNEQKEFNKDSSPFTRK